MKKVLVIVLLIISLKVCAQTKIGTSPTVIQNGQLLQLEKSGTRAGLKIAEVSLTGTTDLTTINIPTTALGTMVWNTATAGSGGSAVTPGFYVWNGTAWDRVSTSSAANNIYTANGTLTGARTVTQGTNNLTFGSTATTTTAQNLNANSLTTGTAQAITANALTTGTGLSVSSSSAGLNSTNGLLQVANTGASTTGILARFQANATAGSGMTITNSGNVGIGTTTPNNSITIVNDGGAGAKDDILVQGYNSQPTLYMNNTGGTLASPTNTATGSPLGGWYLGGRVNGITSYDLTTIVSSYRGNGTTSLSDLQFSTSGSARMTINENGNVGIGTTSPVGALNIVNNATGIDAKDNLVIQTYKGGSTNAPGVIILSDNGTESLPTNLNNGEVLGSVLFGGRIGGASVRVSEVTGTYKGNGTTTLSDLQFKTSGTTRMTIDENGNVGIGTTTPNSPLQFANTLENRKIVLWENSNNDHQFYGLGINSSIQRYQVAATSADHVFFAATSATTSNELMRIRGNGNVGIGTVSPGNRLEINSGTANTSGLRFSNIDNATTRTTTNVAPLGVNASGDVVVKGYTSGEVIQMRVFSGTGSITGTTAAFTATTQFSIPAFTPLSSSSTIVVEVDGDYSVSGGGVDVWGIQIRQGTTAFFSKNQRWTNASASGTGTRSGVLLPAMGIFANTSTASKSFNFLITDVSSDDSFTLGSNRTVKITEIQN